MSEGNFHARLVLEKEPTKPLALKSVEAQGDTLMVDLWYPRSEPIRYVEVGLVDVRAADAVRISYDFDRDGYVIEQASRFVWADGDEECDEDWREVAFVQAWAREETENESESRLVAWEGKEQDTSCLHPRMPCSDDGSLHVYDTDPAGYRGLGEFQEVVDECPDCGLRVFSYRRRGERQE